MSTAEKLMNKGRAEGIAEGITKGRIDALLRLLTKRFGVPPPSFLVRLQQAPLVDLDRWTDRVLDAASLAGVFADAR